MRCSVDVPGQACQLCYAAKVVCTQLRTTEKPLGSCRRSPEPGDADSLGLSGQQHVARPTKRRRHELCEDAQGQSPTSGAHGHLPQVIVSPTNHRHDLTSSRASVTAPQAQDESGSKSAMIVGPVMAEDVQMIENYMSSHGRPQHSPGDSNYNTISDNPQDPVLYLTVPRKRQGLIMRHRPGEKQREIFEQILGPFVDDVVALYFEFIHPSFPVLDEEHFVHLFKTGNKSLSAALVCELLASSLIFWNRSKSLQNHPSPDLLYAWNLAVAALQEEFLAPGMSTINAVLLDLMGRPTTSITGNTINSGRTVGLSHILGLNRDPSTWRISDTEKKMRVRLWWGVLIHDRWSSFAHGVPTYVSKNQYEVPVPTVDVLMTSGMENLARRKAAECFIALCTLTEILGDILPLVYDRRQKPAPELSKPLRRFQNALDDWEDSEPAASLLKWDDNDGEIVSGSSSLKLGFLSIKMLICRVSFRSATHFPEPDLLDMRRYSQAILRESAREIIKFLCSLKSHHLAEFWSPYSAYHISSATIIFLRCTIEASDSLILSSCKTTLLEFMQWLRHAKEVEKWDLADICLAQCEGPILQICNGNRTLSQLDTMIPLRYNPIMTEEIDTTMFNFNGFDGGVHTGPSVLDTQNNVNGFEYPYADLWDLF